MVYWKPGCTQIRKGRLREEKRLQNPAEGERIVSVTLFTTWTREGHQRYLLRDHRRIFMKFYVSGFFAGHLGLTWKCP